MKTILRALALTAIVVGVGVVDRAPTGSPVEDSRADASTVPAPAPPEVLVKTVAPAVVPAFPVSEADGVSRTGQLIYTPPNADVPESERRNPDDVICPNREPCGP